MAMRGSRGYNHECGECKYFSKTTRPGRHFGWCTRPGQVYGEEDVAPARDACNQFIPE